MAAGCGDPREPAAPPRDLSGAILGVWESTETTQGGLGAALRLSEGGVLATAVVVILPDSRWRLEGGMLTVEYPGKEGAQALAIDFDELGFATTQGGRTVRRTRVRRGPQGAPPVVGVWKSPHYAGGTAYERYTEDGRLQFRLPIASVPGRWNLEGDVLTLASQGQPAKSQRARLEPGGFLRLSSADGSEDVYRRLEGGDWYP